MEFLRSFLRSQVIFRGDQWCRRNMLAVLLGYVQHDSKFWDSDNSASYQILCRIHNPAFPKEFRGTEGIYHRTTLTALYPVGSPWMRGKRCSRNIGTHKGFVPLGDAHSEWSASNSSFLHHFHRENDLVCRLWRSTSTKVTTESIYYQVPILDVAFMFEIEFAFSKYLVYHQTQQLQLVWIA